MKFCRKCGNAMDDAATFCGKCGTAAEVKTAPAQAQSESAPAPQGEPAPAQQPQGTPNPGAPNGYYAQPQPQFRPQPKPPVPHYAPGSFAETFQKNISGNMLFMIAIILTSVAVFLQLVANIVGIANDAFAHVFYMFGTIITGGTVCTAIWLMYIAAVKPARPEKSHISFLLLKIFFVLAILWQALGLLVELTSASLSLAGASLLQQAGMYGTQIPVEVSSGLGIFFKALIGKCTIFPYLCVSLIVIHQLENSFKENKNVITISKMYGILCFVYAGGAFIAALISKYAAADIIVVLAQLINAAAMVLYGMMALKGADKKLVFSSEENKPY